MNDYQTILNEVFDEFGIVGSLDFALDMLDNSNLEFDLELWFQPDEIRNMLKSGEDIMIMTPKDYERVTLTAIYEEEHGGYDYISFDYDTEKVEGVLEELGVTTRLPQSFFDADFTIVGRFGGSVKYQVSPYDSELVAFLSCFGKNSNILEDGKRKQFIDFNRKNIHDEYNNQTRIYHTVIFKFLKNFRPTNMPFPVWLKKSLEKAFEARKL